MKRNDLTVEIMENRGFYPANPDKFELKDIVSNIQNNGHWAKFRMVTDKKFTTTKYTRCATYNVYWKREFLEVFDSLSEEWNKVAYRDVEVGRVCKYAD